MAIKDKTYLTLIIVPHQSGRTVTLRLPTWAAKTLAVLAVFLIVGLVGVTTGYVSKVVDVSMLQTLKLENRILRGKVSEFGTTLAGLQGQINDFVSFDSKVRMMSGLVPIDPDVRRVGVGGFTPASLPEGISSGTAADLNSVQQNLARLDREARLQLESFESIVSALSEKQEMWNHLPSIQPTPGWIISNFGIRRDPLAGDLRMHEGIDIAGPDGTIIAAPAAGSVKFVGYRNNYGLCLEIDHGYGIMTRYAHCSMVKVSAGQNVNRGQVVALVGQTGRVTGPHLHYEVVVNGQPKDPANYILSARMF
ncbi:MAG: M23 family metallopeptidase [bacterium]|nr:M23 family metallopeptidase [bacterium]